MSSAEADHIDVNATGRQLGAYKTAAARTGCTLEEWMNKRMSGFRWCFRCCGWKETEHFSTDVTRLGGRASSCKACTSMASTASRYGMTVEEFKKFREDHGNKCAICENTDILYVDHDHKTGAIRGLLCPQCNSAIGLMKDNPKLFLAAVRYLERSNAKLED